MVDSKTFTQSMLSNPTRIASQVIRAMEASGTSDDPITIDDPNNGFTMMLLANSYLFSNFSKKIDNTLAFLYPHRARNAAQLYPHLSQFDYLQLTAAPATLPFIFVMGKQWAITNSVYFNDNYNKLIIPSTSYFTMGDIRYSMYYPIELLINKTTGSISAYYDTAVKDSFNTLNSNQLLDVQEYTQNGIDLFRITFNMYQFKSETTAYVAGQEQGFSETLSFEDQFYGVKVYYQNTDLSYTELNYSLSEMYYDYQVPTAVIKILSDVSQINITIPKIYFDNNQLSQNIVIKLYTTKGSVNYSVSAAEVEGLTAFFDPKSTPYAAPFDKSPTWTIVPEQIVVSGGSNAMSFKDVRRAIVNQIPYNRVAITNNELLEAGAKYGFKIRKVVDDLTERVFYASNVLKDTNDVVIPVFSGSIILTGNSLIGDSDTIINHSDGYHTVLPTTLFKLPNSGTTCVPLTNAERQYFESLAADKQINELNTGRYLRQPFHITLKTAAKYPKASTYNLMTPAVKSLSFIAENPNSAPQMSVVKMGITHQNSGTGGYLLNLLVVRSSNIAEADLSNYQIIVVAKDVYGQTSYLSATYISTANGIDLWQTVLGTSYHINQNDVITVTMNDTVGDINFVDIKLEHKFTILSCFATVYDTSISVDSSLNSLLPNILQNQLTVMAQQEAILTLGRNMTASIYSGVNTTWGNEVYQTADNDVFYTTPSTVFLENQTGIMTRYNSSSNSIDVVKLYDAGDVVSSEHDIVAKTTSNRNPPSSGTTTLFYVDDVRGILVGQPVRGLNIPVGSTVDSIGANFIRISSLITDSVPSGTQITITNQRVTQTTSVAQSNVGTDITVSDVSGIIVGMTAFGFDIPYGATVTDILTGNVVRLSVSTTAEVADDATVVFINKTAKGVLKIAEGSVLTDTSGNPIVLQESINQYRIPTILFDGRLFESNDPADIDTIANVYPVINSYVDQVSTLDAGLLEGNQVYYLPLRSMGYGEFGIGNGQKKTLRIELSFSVKVYVSQAVYNDVKLTASMKETIYKIINNEIQNDIISVSDITDVIKQTLDTNVIGVEMGGINGDDTLRLISLLTFDIVPSVEYKLIRNPDNTVSRDPNITVEFIPSPTNR